MLAMIRLRRFVVLLAAGLVLACGPSKSSSDTGAGESSSTESSGTDGSGTEDSDTETGVSETETGEPECDYDGYIACNGEAFAAYDICMAACEAPDSCAGVGCGWSCRGERDWASIACAEQAHCPSFVDDARLCEAECHTQAGECPRTPNCDPNDCNFAEMVCVAENCHPCEDATLHYAYADSCEIQLPATVPVFKLPYTFVEVFEPDYMGWVTNDDPQVCDEPGVGGLWSLPNYDGVSLCPAACDAFALAGSLRVEFASPPCE